MKRPTAARKLFTPIACAFLLTGIISCASGSGGRSDSGVRVRGVQLADTMTVTPVPTEPAGQPGQPIALAAAKNEWVNYVVRISGPSARPARSRLALRLQPLNLTTANARVEPTEFTAYQVVDMPVDTNRAGYVRHTGQNVIERSLPRALLPLKAAPAGLFDLAPPLARANAANENDLLIWIDVHVPPGTRAGAYQAKCDVIEPEGKGDAGRVLATVPVRLDVADFVLPDERHLMMVGSVDWADLLKHYPAQFEAVTPRLMSRADPRYAPAIRTLDQLVRLAQQNRTQLVIPQLQPTVKWPAGRPPQVTWDEYDGIVAPWLKGDVFADKTPYGYWPLPAAEKLSNYDVHSQREYWSNAAAHFDQMDWLTRSAAVLHSTTPGGRADSAEALRLSGDAAALLQLNQRLRVEVPLEDDQVQFASSSNPNLVQPDSAERLITANPGIVFTSPVANWPTSVARPARWLRTDLTGLIPYIGAGGDERDVRLWAWLAAVPLPPPQFGVQYGPVKYVRWPGALPKAAKPTDPADPSELIWFYPGSWFGLDEPVPTVQLKWLRRAQQDFEYLYLARQRGEAVNALIVSRLMSKPVELAPNQSPDPTFGLMSGTADPDAWNEAIELLTRYILLRDPGQTADESQLTQLGRRMNRWAEPQERPVIMGRSVRWLATSAQQWWPSTVDALVGIDIYNAADRTPDQNLLTWTQVPSGWQHRPQPKKIDQLATYHVQRFDLGATVEPNGIRNTDRGPIEVQFTDGFTKKTSTIRFVLPAAFSDRRVGGLKFDGSLDDWSPDDLIVDGPLVRMFNRPALQRQELQVATTPSSVYTAWADENFYVAFKVTGSDSREMKRFQNFVDYEFRRAWGEDLVELLIQPVFGDNSLGPVLHLVCKPTSYWVERKMDPRQFVNPWQPIEGTAIRYAAIPPVDGPEWRGEVAIPWQAITADATKGRPLMLRFNFTQHKTLTGESASWAGPVDYGRDENFTGVLILREPNVPGMGG